MSSLVRQSTNTFTKELNTRINLLSSSNLTANLDNSNYKELTRVIESRLQKSPEEITIEDIKSLNKSTIRDLLVLCNENLESVDYLVSRLDDYNDFYVTIYNIIKNYIKEYNTIDDNQTEMIRNKIALYQKYIDRFEAVVPTELFDDMRELNAILDTGFSDEDKTNVEMHIGKVNLSLVDEEELEFATKINEANEMLSDFLLDDAVHTMLDELLPEMEIDIDLIPYQAEELSKKINIEKRVLADLLALAVANNMYASYISIDKEEKEEKRVVREVIEQVLSFIKPVHERIYYRALDIIEEREDYFIDKLSQVDEEEIYNYLETPISVINEKTGSMEEAINLKELSVIKPMIETVNSMDNISPKEDEYESYSSILAKLVEQYCLLEAKKRDLKEETKSL